MKRILLIVTTVLIGLNVSAQIKFGIKAGVNLPDCSIKENGNQTSFTKMSFGFHLGGVTDIRVSESFSLQPAILLSTKGCKEEMSSTESSVNVTVHLNYLEIPVNALLRVGSGNTKFLIFGGPYLAYALSGTVKGEADGLDSSMDITFGQEEGNTKPLDLGLNFGAGVEIKSFQITAQYGLGLTNLSNRSNETVNNNVIGFSIAYLFGKK
jgi:hypothetical protein